MSVNNSICALLATSIVAGTAGAGVLTMTANNLLGEDDYASLKDYRLVLTIDCATMDDAGSSSTFNLNGWDFKAFNNQNQLKFHAIGTNTLFSVAPGATKFNAVIGLTNENILIDLMPAVRSISFSYAFDTNESLYQAINNSANSADGELSLGTGEASNPGGILAGSYAVPTPAATALLGLAGLIGRRRRG